MDKRNRGNAPRHVQPKGLEMDGFVDRGEEGVVEGRNALLEALDAGVAIDKVYIAKGDIDATLRHIASRARDAGAVVVETDRRKLDSLSRSHSHQGILALTAVRAYASIEDILQLAQDRGEPPLVVICDEITDSHNLGAIIRTAEATGAHGIVIPKRRSVGITPIVQKTSAGAVNHLPVARVPNLTAAIQTLQKAGLWIYGAAMEGESVLWDADLKGPVGIVIGSEGDGLGRLVSKHCDFLVRIPMAGKVQSLNASVSAAVMLYEVIRQRRGEYMKF
ncbi:MAG: 23S rRNA (guanosine(2251)-2'-O)-methyltransferase RlmB [Oscillospiraceae bacterium]|nr:23S rRNA (guanosine(2251)-2'-O)-methyltransferase RlmB [Oscillospiraceae bacterium]